MVLRPCLYTTCVTYLHVPVYQTMELQTARHTALIPFAGIHSHQTSSTTYMHSVYQYLIRFNNIAIKGTPHIAVDEEAIILSRVYSYYSKCTCRYSMCNPP